MTDQTQAHGLTIRDAAQWSRRASDLYARGDSRGARRSLEFAVKLQPGEASHLLKLGRLLLETQEVDNLRSVIEMLSSRFPSCSETHLLAGHFHKIVGQPDLAVAAYRRALALDPASASALFNLSDLDPLQVENSLQLHMQALRGSVSAPEDRANVCFALARINDAVGAYDQAFQYYEEANAAAADAMGKHGIKYDPDAVDKAALKTMESQELLASAPALEPLELDLRMIFIVGLPRSGTTLVEQLLACHDDVAAGGELPFMQDCLREFERRGGDLSNVDLLAEMRELYLDGLFGRDLDKRYVTDKLPGNFTALGLIRRLFPLSVIVHCKRDPRAVCWSLFSANFGMHEPYYNSFEHLAHYHRVYQRLMQHWRAVMAPPIVEVQYEELIRNVKGEARRLLGCCGLEWNPGCVDFHSLRRPIFTASQIQVRQPVYASSVARWRHYEKNISPLIKLLADAP